MTIKIDKNIPLPVRASYKRPEKYPEIRLLEVGDSIAVPITSQMLYIHGRRVAKDTGRKFVVRTEANGSRIWRKQ